MECTESLVCGKDDQLQGQKADERLKSENTDELAGKANDDDEVQGEIGGEVEEALSKTQMKKLKKKEKWEQVKVQKRKAEKERYKARKRACLERGEQLGPTRKQLRHNKMSKSSCKVQVVVDCDFDQYMAEKDIKMLVKQIQFSYSANRRAENPLQFHCCGIGGKTKQRLENLGDYKGWDVHFHSDGYLDVVDKSSVVYLSSESPNLLGTLEDDKVYIIGGLVDHNHHKGLCHRLAEEKGLAHAQLPIADYIDMKTRKVLAINHVFEILLNYTETRDWQKSFYKVLPPRKGAVPKLESSLDKEDTSCDKLKPDISSQTTEESVKKDDGDEKVEQGDEAEVKEQDLVTSSNTEVMEPPANNVESDNLLDKPVEHLGKVSTASSSSCTADEEVEHLESIKSYGDGEERTTSPLLPK